jgi:1,4-alpha-glucan branching enzyme
LFEFDGLPLYEYTDKLKQEHKSWGTRVFDYGRPEVRSFLISACSFWFENYHIDGMRLDAVASMLYLDYDRKDGEFAKNIHGGNYNLEAIDFLRQLNSTILTKFPYALMIAEESTAFPGVTLPPDADGLGFNYKWNMGWMNDTLKYISIDPFFRKGAHNKLTFPIAYAFSENYVLPFSHDEVVHGKCSMISKMPGEYKDKFSALRAIFSFQYASPGKKLNFMGGEFGQFIEWDYKKQLDWFLLNYDSHKKMLEFSKALNKLYVENKPLYELDLTYDGFKWIISDDNVQNVVAFYRQDSKGNKIVVIINFSDVPRQGYTFGVPDGGKYEVILDSQNIAYGGTNKQIKPIKTKKAENHGFKDSISINLLGNQGLFLRLAK